MVIRNELIMSMFVILTKHLAVLTCCLRDIIQGLSLVAKIMYATNSSLFTEAQKMHLFPIKKIPGNLIP